MLKANTKQFSYKGTYESDQDEEVEVSQSYEYAPGWTHWGGQYCCVLLC